MAEILPPSFLVAPIVEAPRLASWPKQAAVKLWDDLSPLPDFASLDDHKPPVEVRIGWHDEGIVLGVDVAGKSEVPRAEPLFNENDDRLIVGIDTRDTKSIHRAGRFCHRFHLTPANEDGERDPSLTAVLIPRATDDAPLASFQSSEISAELRDDGYCLVAVIRAAALNGFDPSFSDRIGLHVELSDREHGSSPLWGDPKMPGAADPSLWASVRLLPE